MGRRTLALFAALLLPAGCIALLRWITAPVPPLRRPPAPGTGRTVAAANPAARTPASPAVTPAGEPEPALDPNLPLYAGDTRRIAAQAVDDTAASRFDQALRQLAAIFEGTPAVAGQPEGAPQAAAAAERLRLDLTAFDPLSFVEQLLALANSRQVSTKTQAVDRFSEHLRRLRYETALVAACRRHRDPLRWAVAAERRGYLVDLTSFLPGARWLERPAARPAVTAGMATATGAAAGTAAGTALSCPPPQPLPRRQAYIPLAGLDGVLPALRSGDLVLLLSRRPAAATSRFAVLDLAPGRPSAVLALPAEGVVRRLALPELLAADPDGFGLLLLRPIPNADGRPDP